MWKQSFEAYTTIEAPRVTTSLLLLVVVSPGIVACLVLHLFISDLDNFYLTQVHACDVTMSLMLLPFVVPSIVACLVLYLFMSDLDELCLWGELGLKLDDLNKKAMLLVDLACMWKLSFEAYTTTKAPIATMFNLLKCILVM